MKRVLLENHVPFEGDKIKLPVGTKHVKLDVGLSYSAPFSQYWLSREDYLSVFSFEPNPEAVALIRSPLNKKKQENHGDVLEQKFIDTRCHIIPVALGKESQEKRDFYITTFDEGCSSFYKPSGELFHIEKKIHVPVFTLYEFFLYFPWETIPYIEYLKIDAQGADLDILIGAGDFLSKVVFITTEATVGNLYLDVENNDVTKVDSYLGDKGFIRIQHPNTSDPTYLNTRFMEEASTIFIYQKE